MIDQRSAPGDSIAPDLRARILDGIVKGEVTEGARVEHRDTVTAILAKGRDRVLVTVDRDGTVRSDRLLIPDRGRRLRTLFRITGLTVAAALAFIVLLARLDILPA
jgi:hypothetical protein